MIKVFATDIDRTLYCPEIQDIVAANDEAINKMISRGVTIVLASSRQCQSMMEFVDRYDLIKHNGYIVGCSGSQVIRLSDGKVLRSLSFSKEQIEYLYDLAQKMGCGIEIFQPFGKIVTDYAPINEYDVKKVDMTIVVTNHPLDYIKDEVFQCGFSKIGYDLYEVAKEIPPEAKEMFEFRCSSSISLDIVLKGSDKASGIQTVLDDLGLDRSVLAATGDNNNDIPMLQLANVSGCVANGSIEAKQAASYVVKEDGQGGVAQFVNEYVLKDYD